jgi:hypothetical protein
MKYSCKWVSLPSLFLSVDVLFSTSKAVVPHLEYKNLKGH